jgi:glycosyltransferase involved in cell wall biosynthesis
MACAARNVRVLLVSNGLYPGGAETFVVDLAEAMSQLGPKVALACLWTPDNDPVGRDFLHRLESAGVEVFDLGKRPGEPAPLLVWRYLQAVRRFRPDVINAHCLYPELLVWWASRVWPFGPKRVRTIQNIEYTDHGDPSRLWYRLARGFHRTLAGSEDMAQSHAEKCPDMPPATVILDGRDLTHFREWSLRRGEAREILGLRTEARVLCTVGRLVWRKNHHLLLHSLAGLRDRLPNEDWVCLICGRGELADDLQQLSQELGLDGKARFLGAVPDVAVPLAASDVFVMTPHYEGLGLAAVEAHAVGLPVVATNVPGLRWVVTHGETGLLVAPEPAAVTEVLAELLRDPERARGMGRRGQAVALARHDMRKCAEQYVRAFEELIDGTPTSPSRG